ncbi:hypothetical protein CDO73_11615 [Saccharibacillus sp. O23]|uniref:hypothetical protein n=1 Tax=Saccharibacillus sp. O23 TaxID=2009338 RepID=UPI000B4E7AA2|nr:hypothetical protein [Saccharibacillus sp. O23]OWR30548.1 hypothetical protein CDO73_11615 [Saccharibacillus sp. O23]
MNLLKNSRFYLTLLLIAALVLAYANYRSAQQNSQAAHSVQQKIDSDFLANTELIRESIDTWKASPDSKDLQVLQRSVSKAAALVSYTSYAEHQPYLLSVFGQMDNWVVNLQFRPVSWSAEDRKAWIELLDKLSENPTDFDTLNALVLRLAEARAS